MLLYSNDPCALPPNPRPIPHVIAYIVIITPPPRAGAVDHTHAVRLQLVSANTPAPYQTGLIGPYPCLTAVLQPYDCKCLFPTSGPAQRAYV
jgi:hypothetical protein